MAVQGIATGAGDQISALVSALQAATAATVAATSAASAATTAANAATAAANALQSRTITAGANLSGGGDLTANRTISLATDAVIDGGTL